MLAHLASNADCLHREAQLNSTATSRVGYHMTTYLWITCILAALNSVTNGFSLIVFAMDKKNMSMRRLLLLLSLSETVLNICMAVNLCVIISVSTEKHRFQGVTAPNLVTSAFFLSFALFNAYIMIRNWCLVLIAGSRCEVVRDPLSTRSGQLFSPSRVRIGYAALTLISLGVYTPRMFEFTWIVYRLPCHSVSNVTSATTAAYAEGGYYLLTTRVHHNLDAIPAYGFYKTMLLFPLQTILPIVLIAALSFLIIFTLRQRRVQHQQQHLHLHLPESSCSASQAAVARSSQDAATKTVMVLMMTFIICELPTFIFFVLNRTVFLKLDNFLVVRMHTTFIGNILVCMDSFSNFIIYSSTSTSFRHTVRRIFHLQGSDKRRGRAAGSSDYVALKVCNASRINHHDTVTTGCNYRRPTHCARTSQDFPGSAASLRAEQTTALTLSTVVAK